MYCFASFAPAMAFHHVGKCSEHTELNCSGQAAVQEHINILQSNMLDQAWNQTYGQNDQGWNIRETNDTTSSSIQSNKTETTKEKTLLLFFCKVQFQFRWKGERDSCGKAAENMYISMN